MKIVQKAPNCLHFVFNEKLTLSAIWSPGSYSDNHDLLKLTETIPDLTTLFKSNLESTTVECYFFNALPGFQRKMERKYNEGSEQPISYLPVEEFIELLYDCVSYAS